VFRISRKHLRDVMVPRESICALARAASEEEILETISREGYTRLPVYSGKLDEIVGLLHSKDVLQLYRKQENIDLEKIIRPYIEMPPRLSVSAALMRFRRARLHLAIVREPDGPVLGLVTLEDLLEEIVGEINDEHDVEETDAS